MKRPLRGKGRLRHALIASAVLHGSVLAGFWLSASKGATVEPMRVYAVNIVSPPPRTAGEPEPERAAPEQEPTPTPEPEAPAPAPPPPAETPPAAEPPRPTPPPARPEPQPSPPQPRTPPPPAREPSRASTTTTQPTPPAAQPQRTPQRETQQPRREEAAPRPTPTPTPPRDAEVADRTTPSSGAAPSPTSTGGDNLAIRTQGITCPSEEYCNNIARQVQRYFRRPPAARTDRGDVCFRIARDGSVSDIEVQRLSGGFAFRLALTEAVEQAAMRNEFGALPRAFNSDILPVCVAFTPES